MIPINSIASDSIALRTKNGGHRDDTFVSHNKNWSSWGQGAFQDGRQIDKDTHTHTQKIQFVYDEWVWAL